MGFSRQEFWSGLPLPSPVFLTQELNPGVPHCRQMLYHLSHLGVPNHLMLLCFWSCWNTMFLGIPGGPVVRGASWVELVVKNAAANAGHERDSGSIPGWGRSPGGGHGNPLQYSCLENPTDIRGSWWATLHRVAKSQTQLKWLSTHAHTRGQNSALPPCSFLPLLLFFSMYGNRAHSVSRISAQMLWSKWSQNSPFCVCVSVCACSTFTIHLFYCYILLGLPWWLRR